MSNNNARNIYISTAGRTSSAANNAEDGEMEMLLNQSNTNNQMTTINIETDMIPSTGQQNLQRQQHLQQMRRDPETTRINMETNAAANGVEQSNIDDRQRMPNLFTMLREARYQLNRSQSHSIVAAGNGENPSVVAHPRTWRENLYEVLSSPVSPRTDVLRAIFTPYSANVRYDTLPTNALLPDDRIHFMFNHQNTNQNEEELQQISLRSNNSNDLETLSLSSSSAPLRLSRQNSRLTDERIINESSTFTPQTPVVDISLDSSGTSGTSRRQSNTSTTAGNGNRQPQRQSSIAGSTTAPTVEMMDDADTNALGETIVKIVTHFIRYLPFIVIVSVKFIHDYLLGILDILLLHGVVYQLNKSIKEQVVKLNQKSFVVLLRDLTLVTCVVMYRFILSTSSPDPFGLLINPPGANNTMDLISTKKTKEVTSDVVINPFANLEQQIDEVAFSATSNPLSSKISVTKTITLGALLYYVAVNDLILKLLTQLIKIVVTMLPSKVIRHKSRARLYAVIEYISQFYRALVPMKQWISFLFDSYTGLEVISGILFSSFYMGAKGFEFVECGKPLRKAIINFVRNMDYDKKPTKDELEAAGSVCPICHDSYTTPVVLECSHIFCDECVNTWFKREQTCPMCRAKVSEDPTWQDGATTYFYQLY